MKPIILFYFTTLLGARLHKAFALLLPTFAFACFGFVHSGNAQCREVCDDNGNTGFGTGVLASDNGLGGNSAFGNHALADNTTGYSNTAVGVSALLDNKIGYDNTAIGVFALLQNTASANTAVGSTALYWNTAGEQNTAMGADALYFNSSGNNNVATGFNALYSNTGGYNNTAIGFQALYSNTGDTAFNNTATGSSALQSNTSGNTNTADGAAALYNNKTGLNNTAEGAFALPNNTNGSSNVALGFNAGGNLTSGSNNIVIGAGVLGVAGEANTTRIGKTTQKKTFIGGIYGKTVASGVGVIVNSNGQLGTAQSSARFKQDVKPMDKASEMLLKLRPVTFRYKEELDPDKIPQFGLIAEEVEKVNPDLVVRDEVGKVTTVRYDALNAMLLNEFLKEHRKVEQLQKEFAAKLAKQQKQIQALTAGLKDQADKIQKVSAQLQLTKSGRQLVAETQ